MRRHEAYFAAASLRCEPWRS